MLGKYYTLFSPHKVHSQLCPLPAATHLPGTGSAAVPGTNPSSWRSDFTFGMQTVCKRTCKIPRLLERPQPGPGVGSPALPLVQSCGGAAGLCESGGRRRLRSTSPGLRVPGLGFLPHEISCLQSHKLPSSISNIWASASSQFSCPLLCLLPAFNFPCYLAGPKMVPANGTWTSGRERQTRAPPAQSPSYDSDSTGRGVWRETLRHGVALPLWKDRFLPKGVMIQAAPKAQSIPDTWIVGLQP